MDEDEDDEEEDSDEEEEWEDDEEEDTQIQPWERDTMNGLKHEIDRSKVFDEKGKVRMRDEEFDYTLGGDYSRAWQWVGDTMRFGLKRAEEACIELMGGDEAIGKGKGADYEGLLKKLPASVILRVMKKLSANLCDMSGMYADAVD